MTDPLTDRPYDRFSEAPGVLPPLCAFCRHLARDAAAPVCAAFPAAIPLAILQWGADHRAPWIDPESGEPGDTGVAGNASITFAPRADVPAEVLLDVYRRLDALS